MSGVLDVLGSLGGERQRDGSWKIELGGLRLASVFGGTLGGSAQVVLVGDSALFSQPAELAACGKMWMPDVDNVDAFRTAIVEAHTQVRERASEGLSALRRLGFKPKLSAPEPRARAVHVVDGKDAVVALDHNGDLVVESVGGRPVPVEQRRALIAPDEATPEEAIRRVTALVQAFVRKSIPPAPSGKAGSKPPTPTHAAPVPGLSQEELRELQAALSDEDDLDLADSDEAEPTAAGVPIPRAPARDDLSDEGTVQVPLVKAIKPVTADRRFDFSDEEAGTVEVRVPGSRSLQVDAQLAALERAAEQAARPPPPTTPARKTDSLLDAFDDDDDSSVDGGFDASADDSLGDGIDVDDNIEPTATTRKPDLAVTKPLPTPSSDEESDLLAALGGDDEDLPTQGMSLADFPMANPTSVNAPRQAPALSAVETQALPAPERPRSNESVDVDEADGFDDGAGNTPARLAAQAAPPTPPARPTSAPRIPVVQPAVSVDDAPADDDFDDGKTRALSVDAALLERLKRGDVAERRPDVSPPNLPLDALDPLPTSATLETPLRAVQPTHTLALPSGDGAPVMPPPRGAADDLADALGDDDDDAAVDARADAMDDDDGASGFAGQDSGGIDKDADDVDAFGAGADLSAEFDDDDYSGGDAPAVADDADSDARDDALAALEDRAAALTEELAAVRAQIAQLMRARESTATRPVRATPAPTSTRPTRADPPTLAVPTTAPPLPPAAKVDSVTPALLDAPRAPKPRTGLMPVVAAARADSDLPSIGQSADDSAEEATNGPPPPPPGQSSLPSLASVDLHEVRASQADVDDDGDGVSLADLQGALGDLPEESAGATQVAAAVLNINVDNDDGDVFGTSGSGSNKKARPAVDPSEDATRIRVSRPTAIALVVEDAKARDRLRKHLQPRYGEVVDAESARAIAASDVIDRVDAIVFVRPTASENNRQGFVRLSNLSPKPRVLVISAEAAFDDVPGVDLRLPLGQKASEVARQVVDGLSQLGVQPQPQPQ